MSGSQGWSSDCDPSDPAHHSSHNASSRLSRTLAAGLGGPTELRSRLFHHHHGHDGGRGPERSGSAGHAAFAVLRTGEKMHASTTNISVQSEQEPQSQDLPSLGVCPGHHRHPPDADPGRGPVLRRPATCHRRGDRPHTALQRKKAQARHSPARPWMGGVQVIGGIILGPSVFGRHIHGFSDRVFPRASLSSLALVANIGALPRPPGRRICRPA